MATLALQAAGSAIGGPLGAFIGASIGNRIDHQLFGSRREGPRLGDLSIQSSRYGRPIPKVFGTMRVAGSLVWATDLVESESVTGAKGQTDAVTYSYSASFAVVLSARPALRVERIWADGKLLRGEQGDLKVGGTMRFWNGDERQDSDPLIASIEGNAPAYRGCAVVVFEDLQLAEYGNRIPMLTFELVADEEAQIGALIEEASEGAIRADDGRPIDGYAVYGRDVRSAIAPLVDLYGLRFVQAGGTVLEALTGQPRVLSDEELGCTASRNSDEGRHRISRSRASLATIPKKVSMDYYDPARDYQSGRVSARGDMAAPIDMEIDGPVVMSSARARSLVEKRIIDLFREREQLKLSCAPSAIGMRPGDQLSVDGHDWRVDSLEVVGGAVQVEARLAASFQAVESLMADSGTASLAIDRVSGPTRIALFDLPDMGGGARACLTLAAANATQGWRPVPVAWITSGSSGEVRTAGRETVLGGCEGPLSAASALVPDRQSSLVIALDDHAHGLVATDDAGLQAGQNLAVIGDELVQFRDVDALGAGRYRIGHLLRGLRGTEWAITGHVAEEDFALIDATRLVSLEVGRERIGAEVSAWPEGLSDADTIPVERTFTAEALRPPSPAQLTARVDNNGDLAVSWIARSRLGWGWVDGYDPGLGEATMKFEVSLLSGAGLITRMADDWNIVVPAPDLSDHFGQTVTIAVVAIGDHSQSHPATLIMTL